MQVLLTVIQLVKPMYERRERMKHKLFPGALLLLALLVTSCGAPAVTSKPLATSVVATVSPAVGEALETASPAIGDALATASPAIGEALATATSSAGTTPIAEIPVTGETTLRATLSDTLGPILVDSEGTPVYLFTSDTQNGDGSACSDAECTAEWPPVTTSGSPVAGAGVIQNLLGTITREDGTLQVTYNGWPLYYSASGTANDHGAEGAWFLVTPTGKPVAE